MPHPVPHTPSSSTSRNRAGRTVLLLVAFCVLGTVLALSGCGSGASGESGATSGRPTASSPSARREADCSEKAILAALPGGATMKTFGCARSSATEWAAAQVDPGSTVFFLQADGRRWTAQDSGSVCGTASAGLPPTLLSYCR